jgi:predicted GNAT superfamily acetyltransferase
LSFVIQIFSFFFFVADDLYSCLLLTFFRFHEHSETNTFIKGVQAKVQYSSSAIAFCLEMYPDWVNFVRIVVIVVTSRSNWQKS